ncbi:hypothetical protein Tco_0442147 [Tanacetum coccineum]
MIAETHRQVSRKVDLIEVIRTMSRSRAPRNRAMGEVMFIDVYFLELEVWRTSLDEEMLVSYKNDVAFGLLEASEMESSSGSMVVMVVDRECSKMMKYGDLFGGNLFDEKMVGNEWIMVVKIPILILGSYDFTILQSKNDPNPMEKEVIWIWVPGCFWEVCKRTKILFVREYGLAIEWNYEDLTELLEGESDEFVLNHERDKNDIGVISLKGDLTIKVQNKTRDNWLINFVETIETYVRKTTIDVIRCVVKLINKSTLMNASIFDRALKNIY